MNKSIVKQSPSRLHTYSASHFIVVNIHLPTYATASHRLSFTCTTLGVIACHEGSKRMNRVRIDFFLRRVDKISTESIAVLDIVTASTRMQTSVEQWCQPVSRLRTRPMSNHVVNSSAAPLCCKCTTSIGLVCMLDSQRRSHPLKAWHAWMLFLDWLDNQRGKAMWYILCSMTTNRTDHGREQVRRRCRRVRSSSSNGDLEIDVGIRRFPYWHLKKNANVFRHAFDWDVRSSERVQETTFTLNNDRHMICMQ